MRAASFARVKMEGLWFSNSLGLATWISPACRDLPPRTVCSRSGATGHIVILKSLWKQRSAIAPVPLQCQASTAVPPATAACRRLKPVRLLMCFPQRTASLQIGRLGSCVTKLATAVRPSAHARSKQKPSVVDTLVRIQLCRQCPATRWSAKFMRPAGTASCRSGPTGVSALRHVVRAFVSAAGRLSSHQRKEAAVAVPPWKR
mmetsp:Transcript_19953/g.35410  ORF Transcript_19953/g.35410 Transcript_19953/m.35410 type:complete len:203 (+) Transcript_19953:668-1276(+)